MILPLPVRLAALPILSLRTKAAFPEHWNGFNATIDASIVFNKALPISFLRLIDGYSSRIKLSNMKPN